MQRGLRIIPTSVELWREYFKLELSYVNKIKARQAIISLNPSKEEKEEEEKEDEEGKEGKEDGVEQNDVDNMIVEEDNNSSQLNDEIISIISDEDNNSNNENLSDETINNKLMQGVIVKIVYSNAIKGKSYSMHLYAFASLFSINNY